MQPVPFNTFPLAISILASLSPSLFQLAFSRINHTGILVVRNHAVNKKLQYYIDIISVYMTCYSLTESEYGTQQKL